MAPSLREAATQKDQDHELEQLWSSIQPDLKNAYLRLVFGSPMAIPGLLKTYSSKELAKFIAPLFTPPKSSEEAKIRLLADLVISLMFPEKKIDAFIWEALIEIEKAYDVLKKKGGGWSKSSPDRRKKEVLDWYKQNRDELIYLKEYYLQNNVLYKDTSEQGKRNFITYLIMDIARDLINQELDFRKVDSHLKNLKRLKQPLNIEKL